MRYILTTLALVLITSSSSAQAPFSNLEFRIQGSHNVNRSRLYDNWHPASGMKLSVSTPFYTGDWEMSLGFHRFNASTDVPGFGALWISSGWGLKIPVHTRITIRPIIHIGNYRMSFDDSATTYSGESSESDFVGGARILTSFNISRKWFLFGETEYLRVQTQPLMHLLFISVGVGFQVQTGNFVKIFLE
ncbi:MAG: hypothetical protein OXE92_04890 [Bacteroidetes bacterium]|nr:hypothetical protein [Bacteroidota bacterium]